MPLAALILAEEESGTADVPVSLLPLTGQTLVEYQARLATGAGATRIILLAKSLPAGLLLAIDRLKAAGIDVDLARSPADAADRVHPDEELLLLAAGIVTPARRIAEMVQEGEPTLLAVQRGVGDPRFERIDGMCNWAGIALLHGTILRETAAMLGDWAFGATLLRRAVQLGTKGRILDAEAAADIHLVTTPAEAAKADLALSAFHAASQPRLVASLVTRLSPFLYHPRLSFAWLALVPLLLLGLSAVLAIAGWVLSAVGIYLVSYLIGQAAAWRGAVSIAPSSWLDRAQSLRLPVAGLLVLAVGFDSLPLGWGSMILALWVVSVLLLSDQALRPVAWPGEAVVLLLGVAILAGQPLAGLVAVLVLALFPALAARFPAGNLVRR